MKRLNNKGCVMLIPIVGGILSTIGGLAAGAVTAVGSAIGAVGSAVGAGLASLGSFFGIGTAAAGTGTVGVTASGTATAGLTASGSATLGTAAATGSNAMLYGSMAATALSGGVSAYGTYQQAQSQKAMAEFSSEAAEQEAMLSARTAEQNVALQTQEGKSALQRLRREIALTEGAQKGLMAAQGIGSSVTAADIVGSSFSAAKMDELALKYNTNVRNWAIRQGSAYKGWDLSRQSSMYGATARSAGRAGLMSTGASLLSTASSVGDSYLKYGFRYRY